MCRNTHHVLWDGVGGGVCVRGGGGGGGTPAVANEVEIISL